MIILGQSSVYSNDSVSQSRKATNIQDFNAGRVCSPDRRVGIRQIPRWFCYPSMLMGRGTPRITRVHPEGRLGWWQLPGQAVRSGPRGKAWYCWAVLEAPAVCWALLLFSLSSIQHLFCSRNTQSDTQTGPSGICEAGSALDSIFFSLSCFANT